LKDCCCRSLNFDSDVLLQLSPLLLPYPLSSDTSDSSLVVCVRGGELAGVWYALVFAKAFP